MIGQLGGTMFAADLNLRLTEIRNITKQNVCRRQKM